MDNSSSRIQGWICVLILYDLRVFDSGAVLRVLLIQLHEEVQVEAWQFHASNPRLPLTAISPIQTLSGPA